MAASVRLLLGAAGASQIGTSLSSVVLAIVVYDQTHSPAWVAASAVVRLVPYLVLGPVGGAVAVRFGLRRVMVASELAGGAVMLVVACLVATHAPVALVVVAAGAASVASVAFRPAQAALTPLLSGPESAAALNAAMAAIDNGAAVVGPVAASVIVALGSPSAAVVFDAATFFVSAASLAAMRLPAAGWTPSLRSERRPLLEGVRAARAAPEVSALISATGASTLVYGIECVLLMMVAESQLAIGSGGVGVLYAAMGLGGVAAARLAARVAGRDRRRLAAVVPLSLAVAGVALAVLATTHSVVAACVLLALDGGAAVVLDVAVVTTVQRALPTDLTAVAIGLMNTVVAAAFLAGFVIAPPLVATAGVRGALVVTGGGLGLAAVVFRLGIRPLESGDSLPNAMRPGHESPRSADDGGIMAGTDTSELVLTIGKAPAG